MKTQKQITGNIGEKLAKQFLLQKGYLILKENYRHKHAEIDIIAQDNSELVFVEVKTRSYADFGEPENWVTEKKKTKILSAADNFIYQMNWNGPVRFDVISIMLKQKGSVPEITHFEDAFY